VQGTMQGMKQGTSVCGNHTAPEKDLSIRRIMDEGGVLLVNLSKGRLGEDSSTLLGGLLVTTVGLAESRKLTGPNAERFLCLCR
jgi:hypothetical protein